MCKKILDNVMCVSRKTCRMYSCKSKIEGMLLGVMIGSIGGIALGMFVNSDAGKKMRNKMMCNCVNGEYSTPNDN
ncbi:MAG: hypothetical protein IJZ94_05215 [Clostridia bacterium]|nr:hypothetical protein [Clostridia bacterium]